MLYYNNVNILYTNPLPCSMPKGTLPVYVHLDPTLFVPGPHTITIVANSATGEVATFSYDFIVPDIIGTSKFCIMPDNH